MNRWQLMSSSLDRSSALSASDRRQQQVIQQSLFLLTSDGNVSGSVGGPRPATRGPWHGASIRRCAPRQLRVVALLLLEVCPLSTDKRYRFVFTMHVIGPDCESKTMCLYERSTISYLALLLLPKLSKLLRPK